MRAVMALLVGPLLGEPLPHFPLYLASAVLVELIALRVRRPLPFALASGAAIGTAGLASEWAWTHVFMPYPWPGALLGEGLLLGFAMALAASCVGGWIGSRLSAERTAALRPAAVLGAVVIFALTGYGLMSTGDSGLRGTVALTPAGDGMANAEVRVDGAEDAYWLAAIAWQGGGLVVDGLQQVSPGVYRTTEPLPIPRIPRSRSRRSPPPPSSSATSGLSSSSSSASARALPAGCGRWPTAPCWRSRSASSRCSPGACTASPWLRAKRPARGSPGSPRET
jgi:hypothetical protein